MHYQVIQRSKLFLFPFTKRCFFLIGLRRISGESSIFKEGTITQISSLLSLKRVEDLVEIRVFLVQEKAFDI